MHRNQHYFCRLTPPPEPTWNSVNSDSSLRYYKYLNTSSRQAVASKPIVELSVRRHEAACQCGPSDCDWNEYDCII